MSNFDQFWFQSCENQNISHDSAAKWLNSIQTKYNTESHRIYHNLNVLTKKFDFLNSIGSSVNYSDSLIFAIVFQYYNFDLKSSDCSEQNCTAFREFCCDAHFDNVSSSNVWLICCSRSLSVSLYNEKYGCCFVFFRNFRLRSLIPFAICWAIQIKRSQGMHKM